MLEYCVPDNLMLHHSKLAVLLHVEVDTIGFAFELGLFFAAERFGGDDKKPIGADLSGGHQRVADGLGALAGELAHVFVGGLGVLQHQLFHLGHR